MAIVARPTVLADVLIPRHWVQTQVNRAVVDFALMFGFAWFVALFAQFAIRLPWTPVPITGQTFAVLVTGGVLGAWRGAGALLIYLFMGMIALPVYAPSGSAFEFAGDWGIHLLFPWKGQEVFPWQFSDGVFIWGGSGGYIIGFVAAAWLVGFLAERGYGANAWALPVLLAGNALVYVPGLIQLSLFAPEGKTLAWGLYPFIAGDLIKLFLAALLVPATWGLANWFRGDDDYNRRRSGSDRWL